MTLQNVIDAVNYSWYSIYRQKANKILESGITNNDECDSFESEEKKSREQKRKLVLAITSKINSAFSSKIDITDSYTGEKNLLLHINVYKNNIEKDLSKEFANLYELAKKLYPDQIGSLYVNWSADDFQKETSIDSFFDIIHGSPCFGSIHATQEVFEIDDYSKENESLQHIMVETYGMGLNVFKFDEIFEISMGAYNQLNGMIPPLLSKYRFNNIDVAFDKAQTRTVLKNISKFTINKNQLISLKNDLVLKKNEYKQKGSVFNASIEFARFIAQELGKDILKVGDCKFFGSVNRKIAKNDMTYKIILNDFKFLLNEYAILSKDFKLKLVDDSFFINSLDKLYILLKKATDNNNFVDVMRYCAKHLVNDLTVKKHDENLWEDYSNYLTIMKDYGFDVSLNDFPERYNPDMARAKFIVQYIKKHKDLAIDTLTQRYQTKMYPIIVRGKSKWDKIFEMNPPSKSSIIGFTVGDISNKYVNVYYDPIERHVSTSINLNLLEEDKLRDYANSVWDELGLEP